MFTRRRVLEGIAASAAFATTSRAETPSTPGQNFDPTLIASLGDIAARSGFKYGSAFDREVFVDPAYSTLLRHHCGIFTPEYSFKFNRVRGEEGPADFSLSDRLLAYAEKSNIPVHATTLIWNDYNPAWLVNLSADRRAYWLERHIEEVAGHYAGKVHSWDVVNEPFLMYSRKPGDYRDGPWYQAMGPDYIRRSFVAAAKADPHAKLVLNEAFTEYDEEFGRRTRAALLRLVDELQHAGVRLDIVGLQGHLKPRRTWNPERFGRFLEDLAGRKVEIYITELDCEDTLFLQPDSFKDRSVAGHYERFLNVALAQPAVSTIITWHVSDRYSPYFDRSKAGARAPRVLPFDEDLKPKPAYDALTAAFAKHARR